MYIDTHAHLNYENKYGDERALMENIRDAGVDEVIAVGWDLASSRLAKAVATRYEGVYFAAGIHPSDTAKAAESDYDGVEALLSDEKAVAVGEIGLDYHYDGTDEAAQKAAFVRQMEIAHAHGLPFVIHSRDAAEDTLSLLKQNRGKLLYGAVMHCFSGSAETAKELLKLGLYISFAGPVTFKNAKKLTETAKIVPSDRILAETDCPYLAPEPYRGTLNTPANVALVTKKLAELRGESVEKTAADIKRNAHALFYKMNRG